MTALATRLRRCVVLAALFGIAAFVVGLMPGRQFYASECAQFMFTTEHHGGHCPVTLVSTVRAGSAFQLGFILATLAYGVALYARPRVGVAFGWSLFGVVAAAGAVVTWVIGLGQIFDVGEALWTVPLMYTLLGAMATMTVIAGLVAAFTNLREMPTARLR